VLNNNRLYAVSYLIWMNYAVQMKSIIPVGILFLLFLCRCQDKSNSANNATDSIDIVQTDTLRLDDPIRRGELTQVIETIFEKEWPQHKLEIEKTIIINNHTFYVLFELQNGVCAANYVMTFADNKYLEHEILEKACDLDFAGPSYEYRILKESNDERFVVYNYYETVADKSVLNEDGVSFKKGHNFENVKINTDTTIFNIKVLTNGSIRRDTIK